MIWEQCFKGIRKDAVCTPVPRRRLLEFYVCGPWGPWPEHLTVENVTRAGGNIWLDKQDAEDLRDQLLELLPLAPAPVGQGG